MKRRIQACPVVDKVDVLGKQAERVYVEISTSGWPRSASRRRRSSRPGAPEPVLPAGSDDTHATACRCAWTAELRSADDVRNVPLEVGGQLLRLADIATVRAGYEDPPTLPSATTACRCWPSA